ncbi:MAG TPA: ethanolamine utilization protein EutJ [Anaerolineaceae bacterium]|nr:ethanolamine utilization protein EutJ [Anaerolineaceae bacterium]
MLHRAAEVILPEQNTRQTSLIGDEGNGLRVGVDLGTAYTVLVVLDRDGIPLTGEYRFTQVVRDGLVVDFIGAVDILRAMKQNVEVRLGRELTHAASGYPPGVPQAEVRATAHVVEAAGMECPELIDEPSAANNVLGLQDGVIVDIGGGTTGIAVVENGKVVHTADEATGGTHLSLVIAGASDISFEAAEALKKDPAEQSRLFPVVRPVMEKMGSIVERNIRGANAKSIILVGGTSIFPGIDTVIQEVTGLPTRIAPGPLFVTPVGIAMYDRTSLN